MDKKDAALSVGVSQKPALQSSAETAARLGVSRWQLYMLAREKRIPGAVRVGRALKFDPEVIEAFIAAGGTSRIPC